MDLNIKIECVFSTFILSDRSGPRVYVFQLFSNIFDICCIEHPPTSLSSLDILSSLQVGCRATELHNLGDQGREPLLGSI